jgi:putative tryptophan/tyrosine transport system substrate-binding protein
VTNRLLYKRREFITLLGGAAATWPLAARAQQGERQRRIGVLMNIAADDPEAQSRVTAFVQELAQLGWIADRNVRIDYRWAAGDAGRFHRYAEELLALAPDVILASATPSVQALQQATRTVPIVFANVGDPVGMGLVASLARPGGNITGFTPNEFGFGAKWVGLLKEIAPRVTRVAVLRDLTIGPAQLSAIQAVAPSFGVELSVVGVRDADEIERTVVRARRECRPDRDGEHIGDDSSRFHHYARGSAPIAGGLPFPLLRHRRRPDLLRGQYDRHPPARRRLR